MISYHTVRNDMPDCPITGQRTLAEAFIGLVAYEFGYSGQVKDVTINGDTVTLLVHTPVLGHYDYVTFQGPHAEMDLLLRATYCHLRLLQESGRPILDAAMRKVTQATRKPLVVVNMFSLVAGEAMAKAVCLALLGEECRPHLSHLSSLPVDDLGYMVVLCHEGNPLDEVLALAA